MHEFNAFLASDIGKIISGCLLFVGVTDILISKLIFGKLVKQAEAQISPTMSPEQQKPLQDKLKARKLVRNLIQATGLVFLSIAVYGLTR